MTHDATSRKLHVLGQIARKIEPGAALVATWELQGGISAQMTALELALPVGQRRRVIVRQPGARALRANPQAAADEYRILQAVHAAGVKTPAPLLFDASGEILPEPYMVVEYVEGAVAYAPAHVIPFVEQIAAELAKLHSLELGEFSRDLAFLPRQRARLARIAAPPTELDHSLDEGSIRAALEPVWPRLLDTPPAHHALLHGDFWPGNLLWKEGKLAAIVDWEDAEVGNPLMDFAITRLDTLWIFGEAALAAFTHHYQTLTALDFTALPYWDLVASLRPAGQIGEWAAGWPALGRADITEATMRAGHHFFVNQAMARLHE